MKIIHIVGARPNFMKIAPIMAVINNYPLEIEQVLVHTGQHYDTNLSAIFFDDLDLPQPDHHLGIGSGTHAIQTARIMLAFEPLIQELAPDLVLIVGDVNSTLACALVCAKLNIPVGHVEAGLRSFDRTMSEEINRLLTDQISDLLFIPSPDGRVNLLREGIVEDRIIYVGNIMIDTLVNSLPLAVQRWSQLQSKYQLDRYVLFTLHRPSNADEEKRLQQIIEILGELSQSITVLFPVHPRTRKALNKLDMSVLSSTIKFIKPLGYLDFLALQKNATLVVTDSGGIQEETTYLGVPCLTIRPNTERPITIEQGTNRLIKDLSTLLDEANFALQAPPGEKCSIEFWDGRAAERIVEHIVKWYNNRS